MRFDPRQQLGPARQSELPETFPEHEQLRAVREFLERPRTEQTARDLLAILDQVAEAAACDPGRDDEGDYLSDVLAGSPNSSREVETLRCGDDGVRLGLEDLRQLVRRQLSRRRVSEAVRRQLNDWIQSSSAHRRHENRLVNESLNRDTGGES